MQELPSLAEARDALTAVGLSLVSQAGPGGLEHVVAGDTYPHRELIKGLGGRWSGARRLWILTEQSPKSGPGLAEQASPLLSFPGAAPESGSGAAAQPVWGSKHYHGHRERLRQRFTEVSPDALADYELLELLLFFSIYRRDTKPIAKALIERFGGLSALLAAEPARYAECIGLEPLDEAEGERRQTRDEDLRFTQVLLKAVHALMLRALKEPVQQRTPIGSWTALIDYLQTSMAHDPTEQFRILFLDRRNQLLRDEQQSRGTVDHTPLYPREVVKRALELAASAIIMVHNHPSGDPTPSKADIEMTMQVVDALETVGIGVHDHVIVGKNRHLSFKAQKLI